VVVTNGGDRLVSRKPTGRPAVFFDRDGVLAIQEIREGQSFAVRRLEDFAVFADAEESVQRVKALGAIAVVVTNQPDVGNGFVDRAIVEAMHDRLRLMVPVDAVYACYHTRNDNCGCREPSPACCLPRRMTSASICHAASWSATARLTLQRATPRGAAGV
jgi:D-glycero-D-manno-heptose 1,7-bisphosphate phosphatase